MELETKCVSFGIIYAVLVKRP